MKLVVGLGNVGAECKNNRHNVGYSIVDEIAKRKTYSDWNYSRNANALYLLIRRGSTEVELLKPQTFMNNSGLSVVYAVKKHNVSLSSVYVIHDDLDIKLGEFKIQKGKGPKDHKGLLSIYKKLGSKNFWHVRVGIENRLKRSEARGQRLESPSGEDYVLQDFTEDELDTIAGITDKIVDELITKLAS